LDAFWFSLFSLPPPIGLNPAVVEPLPAANPPFYLEPLMEVLYPQPPLLPTAARSLEPAAGSGVPKRKAASMATASTGATVPVPMARSRLIDDAAKTPSKRTSVIEAAAEDDDDGEDDVSDMIDNGADEKSYGDSRVSTARFTEFAHIPPVETFTVCLCRAYHALLRRRTRAPPFAMTFRRRNSGYETFSSRVYTKFCLLYDFTPSYNTSPRGLDF